MSRRLLPLAAITAGALSAQFLTGPPDQSVVKNSIVNFAWNVAPAPGESFQMKVFQTGSGALELALEFPAYVNNQSYTFRSGNYRVETRVCRPACVNGTISFFSVANRNVPPPAPHDVACTLTTENEQNRLDCQWTEVPEADFYFARAVQPQSGPGGGALTVAGQQTGKNQVRLTVPNGRMYFLVQACTGDVCGPQSAPREFLPSAGHSKVPILSSPIGGSTIDSGASAPAVFFAWNRIAEDNGEGRILYRLYVQDFSRNSAALDVYTLNNYYAAYLNPGARYDALVIAAPNPYAIPTLAPVPILGGPVQGPPAPFIVRGKVPNTPTVVSPGFGSHPGTVYPLDRLIWTPIPDARRGNGQRPPLSVQPERSRWNRGRRRSHRQELRARPRVSGEHRARARRRAEIHGRGQSLPHRIHVHSGL